MFGYYRFFLALLVLLDHLGWRFHRLNPGAIAVVSFYILAGYVVSHLFDKVFQPGNTRIIRFYLERLLRIYPMYLYVFALTFIFLIFTHYGNPIFEIKKIIQNLLIIPINYHMFLNNMILQNPQSEIVPMGWSLGLELQAYVLLSIIIHSKPAKVILSILSLLIFIVANGLSNKVFGYILLPGTFFIFVLGNCLYNNTRFKNQTAKFDKIFPLICFAICFLGIALLRLDITKRYSGAYEILIGIIIGYSIITFFSTRPNFKLPLNNFFGDLSYGIFISHFLSFCIIFNFFPWIFKIHKLGFFVATAISLLISIIGVSLFDKPLFKWRHKLSKEFTKK